MRSSESLIWEKKNRRGFVSSVRPKANRVRLVNP
jgi:hypothetical protein